MQKNEHESLEPLLVTLKDAAKMLSLSERKLWELKAGGAIPHLRVGRAIRFQVADLKAWIASCTRKGTGHA